MGKMHEVLAVEGDREGLYKRVIDETIQTFSKRTEHFLGFVKTLTMFDEKEQNLNTSERKELVTTVHDKLAYASDSIIPYLDVVLQKEATNQIAKADLVVDGITIAKDVPATFLLGLESKLKVLRGMYEVAPTLDPGVKWEPAPTLGDHVYTGSDNEKFKTAKKFQFQVLVAPTDKHPAQVEKWEEQIPVGKYTTEHITGKISPAEKSVLLGRIDKLIQATKQARMRANSIDTIDRTIGAEIFKFING